MKGTKAVHGILCPECGGPVFPGEEELMFDGANLGIFETHVCGQCGESSFTLSGSRAIDRAAKAKGLFGIVGPESEHSGHHPKPARADA
jgi:hypothetical protein